LADSLINRNIAINMGTSKNHAFAEEENTVAKYAKALSHPARVLILNLLIEKQACVCGDIVDEIPLSQSTVSQHLKELKAAGLIKGEIEGTSVCYCIDAAEWEKAKTALNNLFERPALTDFKCC
jgi:DNA-binding transcriptional ArsR family regulator